MASLTGDAWGVTSSEGIRVEHTLALAREGCIHSCLLAVPSSPWSVGTSRAQVRIWAGWALGAHAHT